MVARSNVGTTFHTAATGTSPAAEAGGSVTVSAGDTALFVAVVYSQNGASAPIVGACKIDPAGANVTATLVPNTRVNGFNGADQDGWSEIYCLQDPVTALGSTGSKNITVTLSGWAGNVGITYICIPWTVTGPIGTITGGHATSVNLASSISSGSLVVGSGGYAAAIACNGSSAPTVNTGTSLASVTGGTTSGSDNALVLDRTSDGALIANTNNADESQLSWVTVTAAGAAAVFGPPPFWVGPFEGEVWLPAAGWMDGTPTSVDQATTALLAAGGYLSAPVGHDVDAGSPSVWAGAWDGVPVGHDVPVAPSLWAGALITASPVALNVPTTALLAAAAFPYAPVGHDVPVTPAVYGGAWLAATVSHDVPVTPSVWAGGWLAASVGHDVVIAPTLWVGALPYSAGPSADQATFATLLAGGFLVATISHDVPVTPGLYGGALLTAPVGHDVPVTPRLWAGALPSAASAVVELPITATLAGGASGRAGQVGHDAAVTALLAGGAHLRAPVGHDAAVAALVAAGGLLTASVSHDVPVTPRLWAGAWLSASAFTAVAPTLRPPLWTIPGVDGRTYTLARVDGVTYTVPLIDGRAESEGR